MFGSGSPAVDAPAAAPASVAKPLGTGAVKVALILPLSAGGNAGIAGQSMRNAAEMALAEFSGANIQLVTKDDSGTAPGAQQATTQAIDEGAEIMIGPLFAHSVTSAKQVARSRGVPMIAFSTDSNVASSGAYLLSFLPESDVDRIVTYAISQGKKSFVALIPSNAYGGVVEGEFKQVVAKRGGRIVTVEHYSEDRSKLGELVKQVAQAAGRADALFIPDSGDGVADILQALAERRRQSAPVHGARHRAVGGRSAHFRESRCSTVPGSPRPSRPGIAASPTVIAPATTRIRCARRRSPMTRWRWWRRSSRPRGSSASPPTCSPIRPASPGSTGCSASAMTAPTSAASP